MKNNQEIVRSGSLTASRRKFIEKAGLATIMSTFGIAFFTSCSSADDTDPNPVTPPPTGNQPNGITVSGNTVTVNISIQTRLAVAGGWLLINTANTLVANINGAFIAMTSVCTHSGCADSWSFTNSQFTCTCHNSIFDTAGKVLQGPATAPLQVYVVNVSGTTVTINK